MEAPCRDGAVRVSKDGPCAVWDDDDAVELEASGLGDIGDRLSSVAWGVGVL